jgi:hypothetical protein
VDHLVFFDEEVTPHRFYNLGGRQSCTIRLKIINTRDGGITFQTYQTWGVSLPDPRPAYSFISERPSEQVRNPCLSLLVNELNYALGLAALGAWSDRSVSGAVIGAIMEGSPCDKAGIKKGDRILKINDSEIHSFNDVATAIRAANQGDTQKFRMERAGRIYDFEVKYPVVPKAPVEEENEPKKILKPI